MAICRYTQNPPYWFYSCVSTDTKLSVDTPFTDNESDSIVQIWQLWYERKRGAQIWRIQALWHFFWGQYWFFSIWCYGTSPLSFSQCFIIDTSTILTLFSFNLGCLCPTNIQYIVFKGRVKPSVLLNFSKNSSRKQILPPMCICKFTICIRYLIFYIRLFLHNTKMSSYILWTILSMINNLKWLILLLPLPLNAF